MRTTGAALPERLTKRADFVRLSRRGRKAVMPGLILQAALQNAARVSGLRVGFTASRKVGNAVMRNRARRRLRAAVIDVFGGHAANATDYVVIARRRTLRRSYDSLLDDLRQALEQVSRPMIGKR